ncbi:hypothetical protein GCM10009839_70250 [Catenulispora yoronensis]|uniref:Uncharacterized protein n=1 Tax=Catenulispora yoronensis TaxID=450799 RepID=A0ABP5GW88_9ACTN
MALRHIGTDPNSEQGNCPNVWVDDATKDFVFQGWKLDGATRGECLSVGSILDHEDVIRIPARMVDLIRKACDAVEGS